MSDETEPNLKVVSSQELDEEEKEFRALRRDLPGVKGAAEVGCYRSASDDSRRRRTSSIARIQISGRSCRS